ncbi:hypothetical protein [Nocardioides daejeonensis]|uniref:hypothetical protein n=1 Tax=Nocardioides daejeonensis TaxID=1046556 RepID=UPI000D7499F2|nr:hypothetical protein [Nocardioides daejeonensis]
MSETKRRKHLIDLSAPPSMPKRDDSMSLSQVQKWVMSVLAVSTILHLSGGLVLFAISIDASHQSSRIGMLVIAGIFGILAVMAGRVIHQASVLTPWVLAGLVPMAVGFWWIWGR